MLSFVPPYRTAVFLARIVMPFSRSRSIVSITRSATSWLARKAPDCQSRASTSVVLPWSTWATIARLRRSERAGMETVQMGRVHGTGRAGAASAATASVASAFYAARMSAAISIVSDATTEHRELDDQSWVDVTRGWLRDADDVYAALTERVAWRQGRVFRYERYLDEPRMG